MWVSEGLSLSFPVIQFSRRRWRKDKLLWRPVSLLSRERKRESSPHPLPLPLLRSFSSASSADGCRPWNKFLLRSWCVSLGLQVVKALFLHPLLLLYFSLSLWISVFLPFLFSSRSWTPCCFLPLPLLCSLFLYSLPLFCSLSLSLFSLCVCLLRSLLTLHSNSARYS